MKRFWCCGIVVFACAIAPLINKMFPRRTSPSSEDAAVQFIMKRGGYARSADLRKPRPIVMVKFGASKVTAADLKELATLTSLASLDLSDCEVDDEALVELAPFNRLCTLVLESSRVTDRTLAVLRQINLLHGLDGTERAVGDDRRPSTPEEVVTLRLARTKVTGVGLRELATLKNLAVLSLGETSVTDGDLKELAPLQNLLWLDLHQTKVTDAGVKELATLTKLGRITLRGTAVTNAGVSELLKVKPKLYIER